MRPDESQIALVLARSHRSEDDSLMLVELLVILILVLVNGLFAGAEIALVGLDRVRVRQLIEAGGARARLVERLRANPERLFATVQIVITVVGATAGAFGGATFARDLEPLLIPLFGASAASVSFVLVVVTISYLSLVLGELVPKSFAVRHAERYALLVAPLLSALASAARPLVWLLTKSSNVVLAAFAERATFAEGRLSARELRELVDEAAEVGALGEDVGEIAARALDFADLTVAKVMIPRTQIVGIARSASHDDIRSVVLEYGYSRLPVYEDQLDHIVGYVLYKDLLPLAWEGRLIVLEDLIRLPCLVPRTMPATALLREMRERRLQLAVVVDEHGGTAGIVTLDDLVEELIGEVFGEIHATAPTWFRRTADGSLLVQGDAPLRELSRALDVALPEGPAFTTIGGLCMSLADRVPQVGDVLRTNDGIELIVEQASERTVEVVRLKLPPDHDPPAPAQPSEP